MTPPSILGAQDGDRYVIRDDDARIVATFRNLTDDGVTPLDRKGIETAAERAVRTHWRKPWTNGGAYPVCDLPGTCGRA